MQHSLSESLLARQAILDVRSKVVGYELLFRPSAQLRDGARTPASATATVAAHAAFGIGLDKLVGSKPAFLNGAREFFVERHYIALPCERVVLELLEDVRPDAEVLEALREARSLGYTIALDDFGYRPELEPLLEFADIIKVDHRALSIEEAVEYPRRFARPGLRFLAEKIEARDEFDRAVAAGYELFQGYFFCHPATIVGRDAAPDRLSLVRLLDRLEDPDIDVEELEVLIASNALLAYKLLVYVNSSFAGAATKVDSIRHAIMMLGTERVRLAVLLLFLSGFRDKPRELTTIGFVRARMCQMLALASGSADGARFLTVGLLSVLDALMDLPMERLLEDVSLPTEVREALLREDGASGRALALCRACERGDWTSIAASEVGPDVARDCYLGAVEWANQMERMIDGAAK